MIAGRPGLASIQAGRPAETELPPAPNCIQSPREKELVQGTLNTKASIRHAEEYVRGSILRLDE